MVAHSKVFETSALGYSKLHELNTTQGRTGDVLAVDRVGPSSSTSPWLECEEGELLRVGHKTQSGEL